MPLTQERLLKLLGAADEMQRHQLQMQAQLKQIDAHLKAGALTIEQAYNSLANIVNETPLPIDAMLAVERERAHFLATSRRNDIAREYARRRRAGESTLGIVGLPAAANKPREQMGTVSGIDLSKPMDDGRYAQFRPEPQPEGTPPTPIEPSVDDVVLPLSAPREKDFI